MYMPIDPLGYSCIKKLQRDNLWHAYNEPINIYSVGCTVGYICITRYLHAVISIYHEILNFI